VSVRPERRVSSGKSSENMKKKITVLTDCAVVFALSFISVAEKDSLNHVTIRDPDWVDLDLVHL
jgi:hypothetical protein